MPPPRVRALALLVAALALCALRTSADAWLAPPAPRHVAAPVVHETAAAATLLRGDRVDLNTATTDDLALLPRVGPALAARIVADRARRGPFRNVDDLRRVPGVGPRTLSRIRDLVAVRHDARTPNIR